LNAGNQLSSTDEPNLDGNENEVSEDEPLEGDENIPLKGSRKRKAYTVAFKLEAIKYAKQVSTHKASEKYNVHRKCIQTWTGQEKKLMLLRYFSFFIIFIL
jgi:hypothetical protein